MRRAALLLLVLAACGHPAGTDGPDGGGTGGGPDDASNGGSGSGIDDGGGNGGDDGGGNGGDDGGLRDDGGGIGDGGMADGGDNAGMDAGGMDAPTGIITGGPCMSGAAGATAYRVRWANGGGTAYPVYEVNGLPDHSVDHVGAYGGIGFTPAYVDPYLAQGGLQLDGSHFVDIEISTAGISSITSAKLSIYGRSFNTTASGSFSWQTAEDYDSTPTNFVSNVAPYQWYTADMTLAVLPGNGGLLLRIRPGPSSDSLVVNRIEICMDAS